MLLLFHPYLSRLPVTIIPSEERIILISGRNYSLTTVAEVVAKMKRIPPEDLLKMQKLVGDITEDNLKYVDCYAADHMGIFIPSVGFCEYAIMPQHTHPAYSFVLFFSQEQSLMPVSIEVLPEHYLITAMGPNIPHEEEADTFTRYIAIMISQEMYEAAYANYSSDPPPRYFWDQFLVGHEILTYLKNFISEYENRLPGYQQVLRSLAEAVTHQIIRGVLKVTKHADVISDKFDIERMVEYMNQNYGEKLSNNELAQIVNMSPSHFIRTFKKEIGLSPMDYLIRVRIDKAKQLLRTNTKSITEVSLQCGFNSASHFSSSFARHTGMTPSGYQKSYA